MMAEGEEYEVGATDLEDARRVIRDSQTSADRLIRASRELEHIVYGVSSDESSLASTEYDIIEARTSLEQHQLRRASRSVKRAEKALASLEGDVVELRRNIAMLNRLLKEKTLTEAELETIHRRLRNATGAAEIGEVGEIAVQAPDPVMFLGYWNRPKDTQEKIKQGWLLTGDLGRQDENGFFTFVARDDDIITSSGYRIGPTEIENCLMQHTSVSLAAVIGLPDPIRTETVTACIVLAAGTGSDQLAENLKQLVRERLSAHLVPRQFIWRDDLPLTATGKIRRKALRESLLSETYSSLD